MEKIIKWFTNWPKDKVLHFALSMIVALAACCVAKVCGADRYDVMAAGWFAGFFAGFGKEIYDEAKNGESDSRDWAADVAGALMGCIIALILTAC